MAELLSEVAAQAALLGGDAMTCGATVGRIGPEREVLARAGAAAPFGGMPGADNTADGCVTDAALGVAPLVAPLVDAPAGAALVAAVPVFAALDVPAGTGGGVDDVTVAVIE